MDAQNAHVTAAEATKQLNCLRKTESFAQISVAVMASCKNQDKKTYQQKLPNKHLG